MSKYNLLWEYISENNKPSIKLSFNQISNIAGVKMDHSFLQYKKELDTYGYKVDKISLKEQSIVFVKINQDK